MNFNVRENESIHSDGCQDNETSALNKTVHISIGGNVT